MSDGRLKTLKRADPVEMAEVQKRYQLIAKTIDDAVTSLQKFFEPGAEELQGKYAEKLRDETVSLKSSLKKAAVRYHDVATECANYRPELERAIDVTKAAERDEADGTANLTRANAMPDPQRSPDGTISPEEQQRGADKARKQEDATVAVAGAKKRLTAALDALDRAGTAFGDAVNCKKYHDGLTDKISWKIMAVFKKISQIFGIIALVLAALAILIPGVGLIGILGVAATAVLLIADSVLLGGGDGSVLSVVLDAVGLGFGGLGAFATKFAGKFEAAARFMRNLPRMFRFKPGGVGIEMFDFSKPLMLGAPKPGFFQAGWNWLTGGSGNFLKGWANGFFSADALNSLSFLKTLGIGSAFNKTVTGFQAILGSWGAVNQAFNLTAGVIIGSLQIAKWKGLEGK